MSSLAESAGAASGSPAAINVDDIRGSMSFAEVAAATGIPPEAFEQQFGVSSAEMTLPMKELAEKNGFDVHTDVREWVRAQIDAGAAPSGDAAKPTAKPED
jgi:hypothetical protein